LKDLVTTPLFDFAPVDPGAVFARHESFHPRYGWFRKGFELREALASDDATVQLGVGKNMVGAIRYWSLATKLLAEAPTPRGETVRLLPTDLGAAVFGDEGYDPFMESPATLWLLHASLLRRPSFATAWHFAFYKFHRSEFSSDELVDALMAYKSNRYPAARATEGSLRKDVACLLRMYARTTATGRALAEDTLDSPFVELGLIGPGHGPHRYAFNVGVKPSLPPEIVAYACLTHLADQGGARSIGLGRLLDEEGGPGRAFKLSEAALAEALEAASRRHGGLRLTETAGVVQLAVDGDAKEEACRYLAAAYEPEQAS
jgi:hypothetical protein